MTGRGIGRLYALLNQHKCKPTVRARVLRLNPDGGAEGCRLRGWHRKIPLWYGDYVGPRQLIREHGIAAYRAIDKRWWQRRGRAKFMPRTYYIDNIWKYPYGALRAGVHQFFETPR